MLISELIKTRILCVNSFPSNLFAWTQCNNRKTKKKDDNVANATVKVTFDDGCTADVDSYGVLRCVAEKKKHHTQSSSNIIFFAVSLFIDNYSCVIVCSFLC